MRIPHWRLRRQIVAIHIRASLPFGLDPKGPKTRNGSPFFSDDGAAAGSGTQYHQPSETVLYLHFILLYCKVVRGSKFYSSCGDIRDD